MVRPKSLEVANRNDLIRADAARGMSKVSIAAKYGLSVSSVCRILAEEISEDDREERAFIAARYQGGFEKLQEIIDGPGRPITSGAGKHVIDAVSGEPAYDPSPRVDAIRTLFQGNAQLAKLLGSEKPVTKPIEEPFDFKDAIEAMRFSIQRSNALEAENEALRKRLASLENSDIHEAEVIE